MLPDDFYGLIGYDDDLYKSSKKRIWWKNESKKNINTFSKNKKYQKYKKQQLFKNNRNTFYILFLQHAKNEGLLYKINLLTFLLIE